MGDIFITLLKISMKDFFKNKSFERISFGKVKAYDYFNILFILYIIGLENGR
jgi:hypothetical protein